MHQLATHEYDQARPVFQQMAHHLAVNAILEGSVPTRIYVDDPANPQTALTWNNHRFYLAGQSNNPAFRRALGQHFLEAVYPQARAAGQPALILYYAPDHWEPVLEAQLQDKLPLKTPRQHYTLAALKNDWREILPPGFELRTVDRELLADEGLARLDELRAEMCSERASIEAFLARSFGVCLVHQNQLVGWCLSEYNSPGRCEVGIETLADYRRRGLATVMASALVERAISRGIDQIGWHCYARNAPSVATALKVGFEKAQDYNVYLSYLDPITHLAVHGYDRFQKQQYARALDWYRRAFDLGQAPGWAYWEAACAAARLGQTEDALAYLFQAIEAGFTRLEQIRTSPHLKSLHPTRAWQALIERLANRSTHGE